MNTPPLVVERAASVVATVLTRPVGPVPIPVALSRITLVPSTDPPVPVMLPAEVTIVGALKLPILPPAITMLWSGPVVVSVVAPVLGKPLDAPLLTPPAPTLIVPAAVRSYPPGPPRGAPGGAGGRLLLRCGGGRGRPPWPA